MITSSLSYLRTLPYTIAFLFVVVPINAQSPIDGIDARANTNDLARQLGNPDPLVRQKSAEALARLAATDQKKIVEGYQLQEKNKDVRLALDWALYRMGHSDALFRVVKELDSGRQDQAVSYLSELESPDLLYPYLQKQNNPARLNAGLMKTFGRIGNSETLEMIKPYRESLQPKVAEAAEAACDEIEKRLGQPEPSPSKMRPRTVEKPQALSDVRYALEILAKLSTRKEFDVRRV
jgi:HEAT repeat protein